jgi:FSR family fosmidomycin resistance protein-like MFS transporter
MVGAPEVDSELIGGTLVVAGALFSAPALVSYVLEAVVVAVSDRLGRRPLVAGSLVIMAAAIAVAALFPGAAVLSVALGVWGTAAGIGEGVAELALVHKQAHPERIMTRWALAGALGDLLAPVLVTGALAAGASWREVLLATAVLPAVDALLVACGPDLTTPNDEEEAAEPLGTALRALFTDRVLLAWLAATTSCVFLDELLVALTAIRLEALGASPLVRGASLAALATGLAVGLLASERPVARYGPRRVLLAAAAVAVVALPAWIAAGVSSAGIGAAFVLGVAVGPMWPLCTAAAYARRPDRPGLIAAVDSVVSVPELVAPLVIAAIAERFGLVPALLALLVQPVVVVLAVASSRDRS